MRPRTIVPSLRRLSPRLVITAALVAFGITTPGLGGDFYIDPVTGSAAGDGSAAMPWRTLEEVYTSGLIETRDWSSLPYQPGLNLVPVNPGAPVQPGDTLWLSSGDHGGLDIRGAYNVAPITIAARPGHVPTLHRIDITAAQHWIVRGVSVSPSHAPPLGAPNDIIEVEDHSFFGPSWDVTFEDCEVFTVDDATGWTAAEWVQAAWSGISVGSDRITVRANRIRNVRFGVTVTGQDARIQENLIDGYSADGMRGLGDGAWFEYNTVKNAFVGAPFDSNHDDGFQSWSVGPSGVGSGEVRDVILRGNVFINNEDPNQPLHATVQAIGCFDGFFVNWTVENNVVITDHWHGISFYGMRDSRIVNNTVIDLEGGTPGPPWIMVTDHKGGAQSDNVVIRNNLTSALHWTGNNMVVDHNIVFTNADAQFVAPPFDLHLRASSAAIDGGDPNLAPPFDVELVPRPQGAGFDVGAYEWTPVCQSDLGFGGPGSAELSLCGGDLSSGTTAVLRLIVAAPIQPAWLVAGLQNQPIPFVGGTLVPSPTVIVPLGLTDAAGEVAIPNLPGGGGPVVVYVQAAFADSSLPQGFGLSNALGVQLLP